MNRRHTLCLVGFFITRCVYADTFGTGANQFTMNFVDIGNTSNAADDTGYGAVNYHYRMGTHEVSRGMIDAYNANSGGPALTLHDMTPYGANGANRPATGVSWNEAARFVNWLNTSQGYSAAYKFTTSGANDNIVLWIAGDAGYNASNPFRNSNAHYFLPSEDEWYKAAYYDPNTLTYHNYATGSDTAPTTTMEGAVDGTAVYQDGVNSNPSGPADITNAGGLSPYGTMAQNGNVYDWGESGYTAPNDTAAERRVFLGGYWLGSAYGLQSLNRNTTTPVYEGGGIGFRVASHANLPAAIIGIDSGGGKSSIGTQTNHSSIGGSFASSTVTAGATILRSGLIEVLYAGAVPYDSDENGLPDAWEKEQFGSIGVDPQGDFDGDADTNLMEFLAGTNPKDIESHFKPRGSHDGAIHAIPIQTIADRKYEVFASRDLVDWYLQETYTGDGTQKVFNFDETTLPTGPLHSDTHPSKYFFRVKITEL